MVAQNGEQPARKLRILMIHGFTQSGHLFEIKTKALKKSLEKAFPAAPAHGHLMQFPGGIELVYPTGPIRLDASDIPGHDVDGPGKSSSETYGWWKRRGDGEPFTYDGMEIGLEALAKVLTSQGPFDGVLGFSQGGAAAGIVASLLEDNRRTAFEEAQKQGGMAFPECFATSTGYTEEPVHIPLKFAVSYSGYGASSHPLYKAFYEPKIRTPMCHFIGTVDTVVSEDRSLRLADSCVGGRGGDGYPDRVVYHPGGHFLPSSQKQYVAALVGFIRDVLKSSEEAASGSSKGEESVEDMDVPF